VSACAQRRGGTPSLALLPSPDEILFPSAVQQSMLLASGRHHRRAHSDPFVFDEPFGASLASLEGADAWSKSTSSCMFDDATESMSVAGGGQAMHLESGLSGIEVHGSPDLDESSSWGDWGAAAGGAGNGGDVWPSSPTACMGPAERDHCGSIPTFPPHAPPAEQYQQPQVPPQPSLPYLSMSWDTPSDDPSDWEPQNSTLDGTIGPGVAVGIAPAAGDGGGTVTAAVPVNNKRGRTAVGSPLAGRVAKSGRTATTVEGLGGATAALAKPPPLMEKPLPAEIAHSMLLDPSFDPGCRPSNFDGCDGRWVFKEAAGADRPARSGTDRADRWHNSGGVRGARNMPISRPLVRRRYGSVSRHGQILYRFHEYCLLRPCATPADDPTGDSGYEEDRSTALFHVMPKRSGRGRPSKAEAIGPDHLWKSFGFDACKGLPIKTEASLQAVFEMTSA
jgi:hypothetical protein